MVSVKLIRSSAPSAGVPLSSTVRLPVIAGLILASPGVGSKAGLVKAWGVVAEL